MSMETEKIECFCKWDLDGRFRMNKSKDRYIMAPNGICCDDDYIWFVQCNSNKLVQIERSSYNVSKVIVLDDDLLWDDRDNWDRIFKINNKLIIFIYNKSYVYYYDLVTNILEKKTELLKGYQLKANSIVEQGNKLYLLPCWNVPLIIIDAMTEESYICCEKLSEEQYMSWGFDVDALQKKIFVTDRRKNVLYTINMKDNSISERQIGDEGSIYFGVKKIGDCFILPNVDDACITVLNDETNEIFKMNEFPCGFIWNGTSSYRQFSTIENKVILYPQESNMILQIDLENRTIMRVFEKYEISNYNKNRVVRPAFLDYVYYKNEVITYDFENKKWIFFDAINNTYKLINSGNIQLLENSSCEDFKKCKNKFFSENYFHSLEQYIRNIE